jgi:hypothetical protein
MEMKWTGVNEMDSSFEHEIPEPFQRALKDLWNTLANCKVSSMTIRPDNHSDQLNIEVKATFYASVDLSD